MALLATLLAAPIAGAQSTGPAPPAEAGNEPAAAPADPEPATAEAAAEQEAPSQESIDEARRDLSRQRFQEGVGAYDAGKYKDAIDLLLEADRAMHHAMFAFNIGLAYQAMGDYTSALRWLRAYLREVPQAEDRAEVERTISNLEGRLQQRGVQQVSVLSDPDGAMVLIDKRAVGVTPWTGELPPGRHVVTLQLRGFDDVEQSFILEAHRARDVSMALTRAPDGGPGARIPLTPAPEEEPESASSDSGGIGPFTWITLGAGVGVLGGALAFEVMRAGAEEDARSAPQIDYQDAVDTAEGHQLAARVLAGVGGALVITGGVLLVLDLTAGPEPTQAALSCTGHGCSVSAGGQW